MLAFISLRACIVYVMQLRKDTIADCKILGNSGGGMETSFLVCARHLEYLGQIIVSMLSGQWY